MLLTEEAAKESLHIVRQARERAVEQSIGDLIDAEFGESLADKLDVLLSKAERSVVDD